MFVRVKGLEGAEENDTNKISGSANCSGWLKDVEVDSVNAFKGREKDYIIFTCVRSIRKGKIGFVGDPRRLNVALTRARYGLFIVGNPNTMAAGDKNWRKCIKFFQNKKSLATGTFGDYLRIKIV